jgi:small subunit ribosomal protein S4
MADRMKGITGENMLSLLERRLDNVIYRMGVGASRNVARQLVTHAHFTVNGRPVNIPSYLVKAGDVIAVKESRKDNKYFTEIKQMKKGSMPQWLDFNPEKLEGKIIALPKREDIDTQIAEHMIVELYSK